MLLNLKTTSTALLVSMLVLLQLVAPLVHGHAGYDGRADGLHIHFSERGDASEVNKAKDVAMVFFANVENSEAMAVDISAGLKRKSFSDVADFSIVDFSSTLFFSPQFIESIGAVTEEVPCLLTVYKLLPPDRAPPVII